MKCEKCGASEDARSRIITYSYIRTDKQAVRWAVKEYGATETREVKKIINEEFRFSKRYEPSHQAITAYLRGVKE